MKLLVVRHGERAHVLEEDKDLLTWQGQASALQLAALLQEKGLTAEAVWHAPTGPARATAEIVAPNMKGRDLDMLGPKWKKYKLADLLSNLEMSNDELHAIFLVGHEPNVSRLIEKLTGRDCRWLDPGEGVCLIGTPAEFKTGRARVEWVSRKIDESVLLKEKLQSKFAVSSFLAGFLITAVVELAKDPEKLRPDSGDPLAAWMRIAATVSFSLAAGLLLAAVYSYDRLAMPKQFWKPMPDDKKPKESDTGQFAHDYRMNGALYAYMVRTWRCVLTPGVWCGIVGFLALLVPNYHQCSGLILIGGSLVAIVGSVWVLVKSRAALGID